MRGRLQALFLAVAGAGSVLFCWISAAIVALVTLRKGAGEGLWLLLWALLPAGTVAFIYGDSGPLALMVATTALALVLRSTVSLSLTVLVAVAIALLVGLAMKGEAASEVGVEDRAPRARAGGVMIPGGRLVLDSLTLEPQGDIIS